MVVYLKDIVRNSKQIKIVDTTNSEPYACITTLPNKKAERADIAMSPLWFTFWGSYLEMMTKIDACNLKRWIRAESNVS